jgi:hypothetical protein
VNEPNTTLNSLQQLLLRLHAELSAATQMDDSSKRLLRETLHDIERTLATQRPIAPAPRAHLADLAVRFDSGHPRLSAGIREFVDLLGSAGL